MRNAGRWILSFLLSCLLWNASADVPTPEVLSHVDAFVASLNAQLAQNHSEQLFASQSLTAEEASQNKVHSELANLHAKVRTAETALQSMHAKEALYAKQLTDEQQLLAKHIRALYALSFWHPWQLLANQKAPDTFSLTLAEYRYLSATRTQKVLAISHAHSDLLRETHAFTMMETNALAWEAEQARLETERRERIRLARQRVQTLKQAGAEQASLLSSLLKSREALNQAVNHIMPAPQSHTASTITWPAIGKVHMHFGQSVEGESLKYNGVVILVLPHQPIRAMHAGRVMFVGPIRGYGQVVMVDHQNGFLSLYANNAHTFVTVGTEVSSGMFLGEAMNARPGEKYTQVYIEVRDHGRPVDPEVWAHTKIPAQSPKTPKHPTKHCCGKHSKAVRVSK